ncbi:MAG: HIRAN domain-containing protein [Betaproteobacteria bacterium]
MKSVYLAWQNPKTREWSPIGRLSFDGDIYTFFWTKGAAAVLSDLPVPAAMKELGVVYESKGLFAFFANRLLNPSRPDYLRFLGWLGLAHQHDLISMLAISGGSRGTDSFELFQVPERSTAGNYEITFLSRGLSHLPKAAVEAVSTLHGGDSLYLMRDVHNPVDRYALALRSHDPMFIVGYLPKYFAKDICRLFDLVGCENVVASVSKVNLDAPLQLRMLCNLKAPWPSEFSPLSDAEFLPARNGDQLTVADHA